MADSASINVSYWLTKASSTSGLALPERRIEKLRSPDPCVLRPQHRDVVDDGESIDGGGTRYITEANSAGKSLNDYVAEFAAQGYIAVSRTETSAQMVRKPIS
jgi:hypothetical protein